MTNHYVFQFWKELENSGLYAPFNITRTDERAGVEALLSGKYFAAQKNGVPLVPYGFLPLEEKEDGSVVYVNPNALPLGYTYSEYISYADFESLEPLEKQEAMLQAVVLDDGAPAFGAVIPTVSRTAIPFEITKMQNAKWENGTIQVTKDNGTMTLQFQSPHLRETYIRLCGFDINGSGINEFNVKIQGGGITKLTKVLSTQNNWYWGGRNYLVNLGCRENGISFCVITFPKRGTFQLEDIEVHSVNLDQLPQQVKKLTEEKLENISITANRAAGTVDLSKDKILSLNIPYAKGWSAKVDGQQADLLRANILFMAIPLQAGHHEIELRYCPPGLILGLFLFGLGIFFLLLLLVRDRNRIRKRNSLHEESGDVK